MPKIFNIEDTFSPIKRITCFSHSHVEILPLNDVWLNIIKDKAAESFLISRTYQETSINSVGEEQIQFGLQFNLTEYKMNNNVSAKDLLSVIKILFLVKYLQRLMIILNI